MECGERMIYRHSIMWTTRFISMNMRRFQVFYQLKISHRITTGITPAVLATTVARLNTQPFCL